MNFYDIENIRCSGLKPITLYNPDYYNLLT